MKKFGDLMLAWGISDMYKFGGSFKYLSEIHKVNFLQRAILVHSYIYYELDSSVVSDKEYDSICKQYLEMVEGYDKEYLAVNSEYGYVFFDFDGSTGFYLYERLIDHDKEKISIISNHVLRNYRKDVKSNG